MSVPAALAAAQGMEHQTQLCSVQGSLDSKQMHS